MESKDFDKVSITGFGNYAFRTGDEIQAGSIILFSSSVISWNVLAEQPNSLSMSNSEKKDGDEDEDEQDEEKMKLASRRPLAIQDLKPHHFKLFELIRPPIDLLVLGTGEFTDFPSPEVLKYLKSFCKVEIQGTRSAAATFNMLNIEGRNVAAALLAVGFRT